jgi:hypothetical protein
VIPRPAKREDELNAYVRGPLFSAPVLFGLGAVFVLSVLGTGAWFVTLLLNVDGVLGYLGLLETLRVTAVLMGSIALTSLLFVAHFSRLYTYVSEENVFFTLAFTLSFLLGTPCALIGIFGN